MTSDGLHVRPTGHLQVKGRRGERGWYALWRDADGRHQQRLGPAHVKDSGRKTPRGATIWRAGDGPRRVADALTPDEAGDRLRAILAAAPATHPAPQPERPTHTFVAACDEWLRYVEIERERARSTVHDYRNVVRGYLIPWFGADTPVAGIRTEDVDAFREHMLGERRLSRRSIQKILVLLHGIFKRAKRKKWISENPSEDAERVSVKRSGEFTVLTAVEIEAVCRAAPSPLEATVFGVAAYTGLRLGELRGLRWGDVDFEKALIHVRHNLIQGTVTRPKSQRVRSVPLIEQAAHPLEALSRRERFTEPDDIVFATALGQPLSGDHLRGAFYASLEAAGLGHLREKEDPIVFHDLRHTFGTLAVQVFPLSDVKAMMGHERIETTMIYVHHVPQHDAAERLAAAIRRSTTADGLSPVGAVAASEAPHV